MSVAGIVISVVLCVGCGALSVYFLIDLIKHIKVYREKKKSETNNNDNTDN